MVDGHDDHVLVAGEIAAVVKPGGPRARGEATTVQPDHHRTIVPVTQAGGVDIQDQAVLGLVVGAAPTAAPLRCRRAVGEGIAHAGPGCCRGWWQKALAARCRTTIRNAFEDPDAIDTDAAHASGRGVDDHVVPREQFGERRATHQGRAGDEQ